jgi:hypothetical protein
MLGNYFYHGIIRKTIIGFGTLFNNIEIRKIDSDGSVASVMKVPIAYGPIQKFLARINQQPDLNKKQTILYLEYHLKCEVFLMILLEKVL